MAITSPEEFFDALAKSRLLDSEQLVHAQDTLLLTQNAEHFANILVEEGLLTEWQAAQLLAGQSVFHIGNYVLLGLLGRGGMGSVFLARHTTMNRQVALKIISRRVGKNPASLARFLSEARATASLDHPNIVRAYDVDQENERFYIVMEYVAGQDLAELVAVEGPLDFAFVADCIRQAAEGLSHAHQRNMVHCDIKPSNLLVTPRGVVKILDMGMARLLNQTENDSSVNRDERVLGTVDYMAPEQALDGPDFDHRADIYSLGCTMYHLLAGHPPFDQGTLTQRIVQHQTKPPPDLLAEHPDTPPELAAICMTMLAKNPADRYQTAAEVAKAIAAWRPSAPLVGPPLGTQTAPSTGVAIDEEEFKEVRLPRPHGPKPGAAVEAQRRFVFWMSAGFVAVGGLLVVAAIVLLTISGGPDFSNPIDVPAKPTVAAQPPKEPSPPAELPSEPQREPAPPQPAAPLPGAVSTATSPGASGVTAGASSTATTGPSTFVEPPPERPPIARPPRKRTTAKKPQRPPALTGPSLPEPAAVSGQSVSPTTTLSPAGAALFPVQPGQTPESPPPFPAQPRRASKPVNPLETLPSMVDVPATAPPTPAVAIGEVRRGLRDPLSITLAGGSTSAGGGQLVLEPRSGKLEWVIRRIDAGNQQVDLARLWFDRDQLMFAWLDAPESADALWPCLLIVRSGNFERTVQLGKPRSETPLVVPIDKGTAPKRLPLDAQFQNADTEILITGIEGVGNKNFVKSRAVLVRDQLTEVPVLRGSGCRVVLRAKYSVRGSVGHLEATFFAQLPGRDQLTKFSARNMNAVYRLGTNLDEREKKLADRLAHAGKMTDAEKSSLKQSLKKVQSQLKCLTDLRDWVQAAGGAVNIHFQERLVLGDHRVVLSNTRLLETEASPQPLVPRMLPAPLTQ